MERKTATVAHSLKLDEAGSVKIAFATLNVVDLDGDITPSGVVPTKEVALGAWGHETWNGALPVGKGIVSEQGQFAVFDGRYFLDTSQGRDAYNTVKGLGSLARFSYGYVATNPRFEQRGGKQVRIFTPGGLDIFEVSNVLVAAGLGTGLMAIKEGRTLSAATRARLEAYPATLQAIADDLAALLAEADSPKTSGRRRAAIYAQVLEAQGVPVPGKGRPSVARVGGVPLARLDLRTRQKLAAALAAGVPGRLH